MRPDSGHVLQSYKKWRVAGNNIDFYFKYIVAFASHY
jgi:hypothetical protein